MNAEPEKKRPPRPDGRFRADLAFILANGKEEGMKNHTILPRLAIWLLALAVATGPALGGKTQDTGRKPAARASGSSASGTQSAAAARKRPAGESPAPHGSATSPAARKRGADDLPATSQGSAKRSRSEAAPGQHPRTDPRTNGALTPSEHALDRMGERDVPRATVQRIVNERTPFHYFHRGGWKIGYYDPDSRIFVATADGKVITVIRNATPTYIENLQRVQP
jgi:hypothetical protein